MWKVCGAILMHAALVLAGFAKVGGVPAIAFGIIAGVLGIIMLLVGVAEDDARKSS